MMNTEYIITTVLQFMKEERGKKKKEKNTQGSQPVECI